MDARNPNSVFATEASTTTGSPKVRVWDPAVRLFHWSLVLLVATAALTGFFAPEWWLDYHVWAGYGVGALVVFRLVWGFTGSAFARFTSFLFSPRETLAFLRALSRGKPPHYLGHNPAGALMVFALLFVLALMVITGLMVLGGQEKQGILAPFLSYDLGAAAAVVHEYLAYLLVAMVLAHVGGVILEIRLTREPLVRAMVTGDKPAPSSPDALSAGREATAEREASPHHFPAPTAAPGRAMTILAVMALAVGAGAFFAGKLPPYGVPQLAANPTYAQECGDCHYAFHPSLLPAAAWRKLMAGLSDHFGEDASLDAETVKELTAYLTANAAEHWDTEAARNFRRLDPKHPTSVTHSPYWRRRHAALPPEIFRSRAVGSKANCVACHKDAETGRFSDQKIALPAAADPKPKPAS